jgi:hypothetical protein
VQRTSGSPSSPLQQPNQRERQLPRLAWARSGVENSTYERQRFGQRSGWQRADILNGHLTRDTRGQGRTAVRMRFVVRRIRQMAERSPAFFAGPFALVQITVPRQ